MKPRVITLAGLPGVGKTSAIDVLRRLDPHLEVVSEHSTLASEVIAQSAQECGGSRLAPALAYLVAEYELALRYAGNPARALIRDRGLEDTRYVIETLVATGQLPQSLLERLEHPDLLSADCLVLLTADESVRARRMAKRGRPPLLAEASRQWEQDFMAGYHEWLISHCRSVKIIDTSAHNPRQVGNLIRSYC